MFRRRRDQPPAPAPIDHLPRRWREPVVQAIAARDRFATTARSAAPGPLQEQLDAMVRDLDAGVVYARTTAERAYAAEVSIAALDLDDVGARLKRARRDQSVVPEGSAERTRADETVALLAEQFATLNRVHNRLDETAAELARLELRLETAVARAIELTFTPGERTDGGIAAVVADLAALQGALDDLRAT
jgi:hypothetical protein